jgi:replicative DNA helicase
MEILGTLGAQTAVIWDLISGPENINDIRRAVRPEMFADTHLRSAFVAIVRAWDEGRPVEADTLRASVDKEAYASLVQAIASGAAMAGGAVDALRHADLLRKDHFARRALAISRELAEMSTDVDRMPEALASVSARLAAELEGAVSSAGEVRAVEAADRLGESIKEDSAARARGEATAVTTGFAFLDERFVGGLKPCDLVYLAARPSVGKTAVMLAMARAAAAQGWAVKIWSLEMSAAQLAERMMYALGGLRPGEKLSGKVDWDGRWASARRYLERLKMYIEDSVFDFDSIVADIAVSHRRGRCDIAFIDYFQLMAMSGRNGAQSKEERLSEMSRRLKVTAMSHRLPLVVASQLNRDNMREGREPDLQDMRGSGSLEQDADRVVFLMPKESAEGRLIKMKVGKNREGGHAGDYQIFKPSETYTAFEVVNEAGIAPPPTAADKFAEIWEREMSRY